MRARSLTSTVGLFVSTVAVFVVLSATSISGQTPGPRFGVWKLQSDAPPPAVNIMTYEPYGDGGMRITVRSTNAEGETHEWGYVTLFDGEFRPVTGQQNAETSVEFLDAQTTKISNRRNGRLSQEIINVLSRDGNTIRNEYIRIGEDGSRRSSHAAYERVLTDPSQFIGTWELVSVEAQSDPNVWVPVKTWSNPVGFLIYDGAGHMSAQLTADPPAPDTPEVPGGFVSYFGRYEVNLTEGTVSHHRIGHLDPKKMGTTVTRFFEFDGDLLRLIPAPGRTLRLTWHRISGA